MSDQGQGQGQGEGRGGQERDKDQAREQDRQGQEQGRNQAEAQAQAQEEGPEQVRQADGQVQESVPEQVREQGRGGREPGEDAGPGEREGAGAGTGGFRTGEFRAGRLPSNGARSNGSWPAGVHGPGRHEQEHKQSHAGNGTVNHGPDDQSLDGLDSDELALRRMMQQAVGGIEPTDAVLAHLRRAVPARRARKRHAAIGAAAALLFIGTAIPALLVSNVTGSEADPSVIAGHGSQTEGGKKSGEGPDGGESTAGGSSGTVKDKPSSSPTGVATDPDKGSGGGSTNGGGGQQDTPATPSACDATQLGSATGSVGDPDTTGTVYGTFRVVNVSSASCTVDGTGTVSPFAQGAADATKVGVADHVAGDAAGGLPDPSASVSGLVLAPGAAYTVQFAWVPSETCPTSGGTTDGGSTGDPSESPTPTPSESTDTGTTTTTGSDGTTTQLVTEDGTVADGSVAVSYTAEAGSPTVSATVSNACAGTVYKTGVMAETTA